MSETPRNDMEHDAVLAAHYHAAAQDEPPPALDDAIRAAARREVGARPRAAGALPSRAWRVPLSIAAVILLSVGLVTLMREEAPEIAQPPRAEAPRADVERKPDTGGRESAIPNPVLLPETQQSSSVGLKPPSQKTQPAIKNDAAVDRVSGNPPQLAKRAAPEAFPGAAAVRENKVAATAEPPRRLAKEEARRDAPVEVQQQPVPAQPGRAVEGMASAPAVAAAPVATPSPEVGAASEARAQLKSEAVSADRAESDAPRARMQQSVAAPAAKPASQMAGEVRAYADLPPEKWLERIEELRKQGRLEEAKTSLTEFKKRYPEYELPASLKYGIKP